MSSTSRFHVVNGQRVLKPGPYKARTKVEVQAKRRPKTLPLISCRKIEPLRHRVSGAPGPEPVFPQPIYSISVSVYGLVDLTCAFLEQLMRFTPDDAEILLWNNATSKEMQDAVNAFSRVRPIYSEVDLGFGGGQRANLMRAHAPYFVVVNNDLTLCDGWLEKMRDALVRDPHVGVVGPVVTAHVLDQRGVGHPAVPLAADYVEASCMMTRTDLARYVGLFDPVFEYAYCEDADYSLRLRLRGWKMAFVDLAITHKRSQTMNVIEKEGRVDLRAIKERNHSRLRERWGWYLRSKSLRRRVLVRRRDAKGDVLMATPILRALRERDAWMDLYVATNEPGVLLRNEHVDHAAPAFRNVAFDRTIDLDLCYERVPTVSVVDAFAREAALHDEFDRLYHFTPSAEDRQQVKGMLADVGRLAVLHPGQSSWPGRMWHHDRWSEVGNRLKLDGWTVAVVGDPSVPHVTGESINWRGLDESRSAALIERARVFIGVDSFPMHLAQAALVPTVGLFGAISPTLRLIDLPFVRGVVAQGVECLGCHHTRAGPLTHGICHRDRVYCMDDLSVDAVLHAAHEVVEARKMFQETSKIRDRVLKHCSGSGIDIGCGRDPITSNAVGFDDDSWPEVDMVGDASGPMPFVDGHFDYVYSSHALEDIADTQATLREWVRILRRGGKLILQVPNPDHYKGVNLEHRHPGWRPHELSQLVTDAGCEVIESYEDVGDDRYSTVVVARRL